MLFCSWTPGKICLERRSQHITELLFSVAKLLQHRLICGSSQSVVIKCAVSKHKTASCIIRGMNEKTQCSFFDDEINKIGQKSSLEEDDRGDEDVWPCLTTYLKVDVLQGQAEWTIGKNRRGCFFSKKEARGEVILGLIRVDWGAGFLQNVNEFYEKWTGINDMLLGYERVLAVESEYQLSEPLSSKWHCGKHFAVHQHGLFPVGFGPTFSVGFAPVWHHDVWKIIHFNGYTYIKVRPWSSEVHLNI